MDSGISYKMIYEGMRDACVSADMSGRLLRFNHAYYTMLGYEPEELYSKTYFDLTPEKWHALEAHIVQNQVITRGFSEIFVKEYQRKDGTIFPVELLITLVRDGDGNCSEMIAMVRDITSQVQTRQELHRSREAYRTLAENSPDILIRFDRSLRHIYANSAAAITVNLTTDQLTGMTLFEIGLPDAVTNVWKERIASVFDTGQPKKIEDTMPGPDGTRHLDYQLVPENGVDGEVSSILVLGRDITERKRTEEALLLAHEGLEQKIAERTLRLETALKEQESFSYSVSHDLRAPLRHINSFLAILSEDFGNLLPPEALALLKRSRTASQRMGRLIDDLLELSRVSRTPLIKETVNLSELAMHVSDWLHETEPERKVEFVISEDLVVRGDKSLLLQLLENLLGNAWKYTSKNPITRIEFGREVVVDQDIFYVRDNGVGFDMEYSDKLFGAFQRLHGPEFEGTGIGLATVKRIIDRHRGRVWATSKLDEGATFYFTLP